MRLKRPPAVRFVLCRPKDPRNVAAVCKVIRSAGFGDLSISGASEEVRLVADKELHLRFFDSLSQALSGSSLVAGITRRGGQRRKATGYALGEFVETFASRFINADRSMHPLSVVFGNETSGLSDTELLSCHIAVSIPSNPDFPSLNLSHAVAVVAWALSSCIPGAAPGAVAADMEAAERLVSAFVHAIHSAGFLTQAGPQGMEVFLRDICARSTLSEAEIDVLQRLFYPTCIERSLPAMRRQF